MYKKIKIYFKAYYFFNIYNKNSNNSFNCNSNNNKNTIDSFFKFYNNKKLNNNLLQLNNKLNYHIQKCIKKLNIKSIKYNSRNKLLEYAQINEIILDIKAKLACQRKQVTNKLEKKVLNYRFYYLSLELHKYLFKNINKRSYKILMYIIHNIDYIITKQLYHNIIIQLVYFYLVNIDVISAKRFIFYILIILSSNHICSNSDYLNVLLSIIQNHILDNDNVIYYALISILEDILSKSIFIKLDFNFKCKKYLNDLAITNLKKNILYIEKRNLSIDNNNLNNLLECYSNKSTTLKIKKFYKNNNFLYNVKNIDLHNINHYCNTDNTKQNASHSKIYFKKIFEDDLYINSNSIEIRNLSYYKNNNSKYFQNEKEINQNESFNHFILKIRINLLNLCNSYEDNNKKCKYIL